MKIALICDTHFGARGDSPSFSKYFERFYNEVFFPILIERGIDIIIHLGDLVDRRKYINFQTLADIRRMFIDPIIANEMHLTTIVGNHDCTWRNTNELNAIQELFGSYPIEIYTEPTEVVFGDMKALLIPWVCDENRDATRRLIEETDAHVVFGHLELAGFEEYKGRLADHGDDSNVYHRFDLVASGHYHHKSSRGGIHYLGAAYEFTWADHDDPRGFHIFDTETRELEFVQNPITMFRKVFYDDADKRLAEAVEAHDYDSLRDCIVKVVVKSKSNPFWFDLFIDRVVAAQPADLQVVDDHHNADLVADDAIVSEAEDTAAIFTKTIDGYDREVIDTDRLRRLIDSLYKEALTVT